ncbi:hypothetical protein [Paraburkholderia sartisoli]|nr:hypothetical protein [Paraburkholderia sartisoli]
MAGTRHIVGKTGFDSRRDGGVRDIERAMAFEPQLAQRRFMRRIQVAG